jgi:hypothetical protein
MLDEFKRYARSLERIVQGRVNWFASAEETVPGWGHVHALLAGTSRLTTDTLDAKWRPGFARIRCYDDRRRAAHYLVKELEPDSFAFSLPKFARRTSLQ